MPSRWACKTDSLATFNCARLYSGTVTLTGELKGPNIHQKVKVVATVTSGRVQCHVNGTDVGEFDAPGMLAVEHASTANAGEYSISVWCPGEKGERVDRDDDPVIKILQQRASDYAKLAGADTHDHPDSDATNGLAGSETITWELRRT